MIDQLVDAAIFCSLVVVHHVILYDDTVFPIYRQHGFIDEPEHLCSLIEAS
jgi:hypothetical protein